MKKAITVLALLVHKIFCQYFMFGWFHCTIFEFKIKKYATFELNIQVSNRIITK